LTNIEFSNVATGDTVSASNSGVAGGGQIGCDYQVGAWVVGVRDMVDATSLSKTATFSTTPFTGTADSRTNWFDTLTARGGYLVAPNVLLYVQGGAAWTNANATFFNTSSAQVGELSNTRSVHTTDFVKSNLGSQIRYRRITKMTYMLSSCTVIISRTGSKTTIRLRPQCQTSGVM
jgi:opacity protein-like surface antigen